MTELWLGYAGGTGRREVLMALRRIAPGAGLLFVRSAQELRERFREEEPGTVGAIIGYAADGVSDMNLAAAIAHDGLASEVVLVARGVTGSLRERASKAGIARVVDATVAPGMMALPSDRSAEDTLVPTLRSGAAEREGLLEDGADASDRTDVTLTGLDIPQVDGDSEAPPSAPSPTTEFPSAPVTSEQDASPEPTSATLGLPSILEAPVFPELADTPSPDQDGRASLIPVAGSLQEQANLGVDSSARAEAPVRSANAGPILTVVSGRGGVGKTALVALMASIAGRWGMEVAMVDLDLSCGNLYSCFGIAKGPDLVRISSQGKTTPDAIGRASVRCSEHVHLWGPCDRPEMAETVMPHVASLLSYLSSHYDLVIADTSTTFTDAVAQAVQSSDRLLVVHDERPGAVSSAARMSALAVRLGVARTRIVRVVNLGDPRTKANAFEGRAEVGLETARLHRVIDGGLEAEELLTSGKVDELTAVSSDLTLSVAGLLAHALAELGRLPDNDAARKAAEYRGAKRRGLFGRRREAV